MPHYQPSPGYLEGRAILVTGAGDGLGRAAARAYARSGAEVILLGKTVAKLESVYDEIVASGGPEPAVYPLDLSGASARDYRDLAENIRGQIGHLEGILHNAAVLELLTPLAFHPADIWERTLRANLTAPFLLTQACLPLLTAAADAAILFTSDECAVTAKGYWGAYGASKAGVTNLALMWARELSDTAIHVHALDPGPARTGMRLRTHPGAPLSSWPEPDALMPAYVRFMGPDGAGDGHDWVRAVEWMDAAGDAQTVLKSGIR